MRIEVPREAERLGANLFYGVQKVYELDAGPRHGAGPPPLEPDLIRRFSYEELHELARAMAIVVPVKGERIKLLEGVLSGVPHPCLVLIVSNSDREPVDRFVLERNAIDKLGRLVQREILLVHQKDPAVAAALELAGYPFLLGDDGLVRSGKAEGMLLATLLARLAGRRYVGFIDADNYIPGAVHEYVREFAAGFASATSDYAMVRISWHSKPKVVDRGLYFAKYGRASAVTNRFLNALIGHYTGFETEVIRTGNAGEHALTLELAMQLSYAAGYAIETRHFVDLLERFGSILENPSREVLRQYVEIYQIESRNPHLHDIGKGDEHVAEMIHASLSVVYHSPVCPESLREEIRRELIGRGVLDVGQEPVPMRLYPPLAEIDLDAFRAALEGSPLVPTGS